MRRLKQALNSLLCEWLVITMKDNKLYKIGFLKNESQTMTFVSKVQSQGLMILGWFSFHFNCILATRSVLGCVDIISSAMIVHETLKYATFRYDTVARKTASTPTRK